MTEKRDSPAGITLASHKDRRTLAFRRLALLLLLVGNTVWSIGYTNFQTFDPNAPKPSLASDQGGYAELYYGRVSDVPWRFLTPMLARLVPDVPRFVFHPGRKLDAVSMMTLKFAVVNMLFLVATCVVMVRITQHFGLSYELGVLGAFLFLGLPRILQFAAMPLVAASYGFFFALAVLSIASENRRLLLLATLVGAFAKEEVVLWALVLIVLAPFSWPRRWRLVLSVLPGTVLLVVLYFLVPHASLPGARYSLDAIFARVLSGDGIRLPFTVTGIIQIVSSLGAIWALSIYAWVRCRPPLILLRWVWIVPMILIGTRLLGIINVVQYLTGAFPVLIPLALFGVQGWYAIDVTGRSLRQPQAKSS